MNESLPPELRDYNRVLDGPGIKKLFQDLAERHPDKYREVAKRLSDVGREAAYATGGFSTALEDMRPSKNGERIKEQIRREVQMIQASGMPDTQKEQAIVAAVEKYQKPMEDAVFEEAKAAGNPFATQVISGARGNKLNLKSLMGSDLLYVDHHDRPIPVPVLNSYCAGPFTGRILGYSSVRRPRKASVAATKIRDSRRRGFLAKQLNQITHRLIVTDRDGPDDDDKTAIRGLPAAVDDPDNEGATAGTPARHFHEVQERFTTPGRALQGLTDAGYRPHPGPVAAGRRAAAGWRVCSGCRYSRAGRACAPG